MQSELLEPIIRRIDLRATPADRLQMALRMQWLVTNGIGGYASGTISGALLWKYHGTLIAALPAPLGRGVMLDEVSDGLRLPDGRFLPLGSRELSPAWEPPAPYSLVEFSVEDHLPVWRFEVEGIRVEKRLLMLHLQNTVHLRYSLLSEHEKVRIELRPSLRCRGIDAGYGAPPASGYVLRVRGGRFEIDPDGPFPPLRLYLDSKEAAFTTSGGTLREVLSEMDAERGFDARNELWSPGYFSAPLNPNSPVTLVASVEDWHTALALSPAMAIETEVKRRRTLLAMADSRARHGLAAELVLAADQFVIAPAGRVRDGAEARAAGDELRAVVAGYPWFTDWGRDTMISLEGLTCVTGRLGEAAWILRAFARYVRNGLIPNLFPEGNNEGLYHTADATLWYFHALDRYLAYSADDRTLDALLPVLRQIVRAHLAGTDFGIGVDPEDGLLRQGADGYALTWMDAKVGDWVVTPRRGKAVEINALWYNALKLLEGWLRRKEDLSAADEIGSQAERTRVSFNRRFWNAAADCLFDVIDGPEGDDAAVRPNQIVAISLPHPVLDRARWDSVYRVVEKRLLTPVGLRSLSPDHREYKARYTGNLRSRDAAYHQGTVWPWLIGPFIDARLKVNEGDVAGARALLARFQDSVVGYCFGTIAEIFDAEEPFTPRGCVAQAWSVAEVLRCLLKTSGESAAKLSYRPPGLSAPGSGQAA